MLDKIQNSKFQCVPYYSRLHITRMYNNSEKTPYIMDMSHVLIFSFFVCVFSSTKPC